MNNIKKDNEDGKKLEQSLPKLIEKMQKFKEQLSKEELTVFSEIVKSAALHTQYVQSHEEGHTDLLYSKPMSVHSTISMKEKFKDLPNILGLEKRK